MMDDKRLFYKAVCQWNKKKNIRTFFVLYRDGFTHYTLRENPVWRVYKIIKNTLNGRYEWCENELDKRYKKGGDGK